MTADRPTPRFEPPPWEKEAFDRFHAERNAARAEEELNSVLQAIRTEPEVQPAGQNAPSPVIQLPEVTPKTPAETDAATRPTIPEARIEAMLVELRGEEGPSAKRHMKLINGAMAFMSVSGLALLIVALRFFVQARTNGAEGPALMFAGTVSMAIFFTGAGFIGGAYMLFRKYHR